MSGVPAQSDSRCFDCGGCCDGRWTVEATREDQAREPQIAARADADRPLPDGYVTLARPGRPCPFLSPAPVRGCEIYDTRPDACRRVMLGGVECNDSRKRHGYFLLRLEGVGRPI